MKRVFLFLFVSLMLSVSSVFAQTNHFTPGEFNCSANCNVYFSVTLDGEALASSGIEVAAFVGDECRSNAYLGNSTAGNYTFGALQIPHDGVVTVTFKMYDHANEVEYNNCSTTITTESGEEVLGLDENYNFVPVVIAFTLSNAEPTGPEYPWEPVVGAYADQMSIDAIIQINGVTLTEDNWEVGVFCGDECRGDQKGFIQGPNGPLMMIAVNGQNGDVLNFYLYDMDTNSQHPGVCSTTITFVADGEAGTLMNPITLNFVTTQTFTKDITPYSADKDHYYLIASPIGEVNAEAVTNLMSNSYDFYSFDQAASDGLEWINHRGEGTFELQPGVGYLYANSGDGESEVVTLTFTGNAYNNGQVTLVKDAGENVDGGFEGWNLVGNPFADNAYITDGRDFYVMNTDGSEIEVAERNYVTPMEGIFVIATEDEETMTFTTEAQGKSAALMMNVTRNRGTVIDRAIVRFGEESSLPKFMLNKDNTKIYIPQHANDYAVVTANSDMGEMPVNFKAAENGTYSLLFNSEEVTFSYLHLIDNLSGTDVDLLENPSYTFNALTTDYASRFKLVFATGANNDDVFGFYSNGSWIINNDGDAILQVVDATGRIMSNEEIHGCYSKRIEAAPGVYMLRLVNGNDVKVQKIVVK